eukprot:CAMPEP_0196819916 /NCGR_PEP_ID=MMETSP1362-20130617/72877_1 /TAXON_ID=163516 /ORGANISM="Leptocylindrus danicus, Strain CCMP1856" /LENGTH=158 /DNA_ID=CAMNT_0042198579 /DNA_START=26 /DNA_END=499 /DNA_ORIENTATION=+
MSQEQTSSQFSLLEDDASAPPVLQWIWPAMICALAYALYNIFIKKGSDHIHPVFGGVLLQVVAACLGALLLLCLVIYNKYIDENEDELDEVLDVPKEGILWSCLAGLAVGMAEMISFYVMSTGVPAVQAIPVIIGGSVLFGSLLGVMMLGEYMGVQGW